MKLFLTIAFLFASQATDVAALCNVNADCTCGADDFCVDVDGVDYETTGPCGRSDARCYCDTSAEESNACRYSRNPPPDDPTPSPSRLPSVAPTADQESTSPTKAPFSEAPSDTPTFVPPSSVPTFAPTTLNTTSNPSESPSEVLSKAPSKSSSLSPSRNQVTQSPTTAQSTTQSPTETPTTIATTAEPTTVATTAEPTTAATTTEPTAAKLSANPTSPSNCDTPAECPTPERDCGWGIWNVWTCQCDCAPGFCLSASQECYDGCTTHLDFNPFGGCTPGCDCPWYPDSSGKTHCVSTVTFAGIYNIHRTAEQCCQKHFSYLDTDGCVAESEGSIGVAKDETTERDARPKYYYPDLFGRDNCVYQNGYYNWMMEANSESYLFSSDAECCSMFYPARDDCPDLSDSTERDVNERPYPVKPYFYPHQTDSNCRFGRNYPQYYAQAQYLQDHLYTTPEECCDSWYPGARDCPLGPDDGVQAGRYWESDVYFYPSWKGNWCNVGNDYPEWMADPSNNEDHLFDSAVSCCEAWFSDKVLECEMSVVATPSSELDIEEWYPTLAWPYECLSDGNVPEWMTNPGFKPYYVFESQAACCKAYYCASASTLFG